VSIVVNNQHLIHNYAHFKSSELIIFPICKNCIWVINLTSSMYMILYFQWQFNRCSTSKTKSLDCGPAPSTFHILGIIILHINFVSDTKESFCEKGTTYVHIHKAATIKNVIYKLQILCILINIPSTMLQNTPTLLTCPATIKMFLMTQIQICQSLSAQYLQQHQEPIFTYFNTCISRFHISHFCYKISNIFQNIQLQSNINITQV